MDITISEANRAAVLRLIGSGRIPHTVIIEGDSKPERDSAAVLLAAGAVCKGSDKPCMSCAPCKKVIEGRHPDVIIPMPSKTSKTGIISVKDLREKYISQAIIKPNEADVKIYMFYDADRLLREDSQNTLLKLIEEPPQSLLFIFTVEKAAAMLPTVRSRAHVITLGRTFVPDGEAVEAADGIVDGIVSLYEYDLLLRLSQLSDKARAEQTLTAVSEKLRLALGRLCGVSTEDESAKKLTRKLDRKSVIALQEVTAEAVAKLRTNINTQLLLTWLCTQYRRITWQK